MAPAILLGSAHLTPQEVWRAANRVAALPAPRCAIRLAPGAAQTIRSSAAIVSRQLASGQAIYGLNTGVGALRHTAIGAAELSGFQLNLLRSHACGVGPPLSRPSVAAMWLILLNSAALGYRGLRPATVHRALQLLQRGALAIVPSRGSVGASGDLTPSAHAALLLVGEGQCSLPIAGKLRRLPAAAALHRLGLAPLSLAPKEALSLMNGTQLTTALACRVWTEAERLWQAATFAVAFSAFGFLPRPTLTRPEVLLRHHPETLHAGIRKREWCDGAELPWRDRDQEPYSFRCAAQVHGAVWREIRECEGWIKEELSAATDNPIVLAPAEELAHGGNFHAIYPARALDRLASALTQLASISERRLTVGMNERRTRLTPFLAPSVPGSSGLMMTQATAAALVSECKALSFPASVDSIPTNRDQEDHVSMGPIAGHKAVQICRHARYVLAIEILAAFQANHLRGPGRLPPRLQERFDVLARRICPITHDRVFADDIAVIARLIAHDQFRLTPAADSAAQESAQIARPNLELSTDMLDSRDLRGAAGSRARASRTTPPRSAGHPSAVLARKSRPARLSLSVPPR